MVYRQILPRVGFAAMAAAEDLAMKEPLRMAKMFIEDQPELMVMISEHPNEGSIGAAAFVWYALYCQSKIDRGETP